MRIILSERKLGGYEFPDDVLVKRVTRKSLKCFNHNQDVIAIVGSRAMASLCADLDLPGLRLVQLTSAGFDNVPCDIFCERGIPVANAGTVYSVPIAETVVFSVLFTAKKLRKNPNDRRFKITRHYNLITELAGKHVLILGTGNIGTAVAARLQGFDMKIEGYDPFSEEKIQFSRIIRKREELMCALEHYDFIISTLPDNNQTRGMINNEFIGLMKNTAIIINVGRKAVFNEYDLYKGLKNNFIGGAVLDMFEILPNPITNKFRRLKNVMVLPGVSAISQEVNIRLNDHIYCNLTRLLNNEKIMTVINGVD